MAARYINDPSPEASYPILYCTGQLASQLGISDSDVQNETSSHPVFRKREASHPASQPCRSSRSLLQCQWNWKPRRRRTRTEIIKILNPSRKRDGRWKPRPSKGLAEILSIGLFSKPAPVHLWLASFSKGVHDDNTRLNAANERRRKGAR